MRTHRKWLRKENRKQTDTTRKVERLGVKDGNNESMVPHDVGLCMSITSFISHNNPMRQVLRIILVLGTQDTKGVVPDKTQSRAMMFRLSSCLAILITASPKGDEGHSLKLLGVNFPKLRCLSSVGFPRSSEPILTIWNSF